MFSDKPFHSFLINCIPRMLLIEPKLYLTQKFGLLETYDYEIVLPNQILISI